MLVKNRLTIAVSAALGLTTAAVLPSVAVAQEDELMLEEVIVTGSRIKRIDLDQAIPVQVLSQEDIRRTGVTNSADLMAQMPAMQGFITTADSVGGDGGGITTANLRGIGDQYTLTLLNSRRMAPADSGSSIDLNNIPLAAVERVEVLTDGASALYGSDAIAGVVNFILKESVDGTTVQLRANQPEEDGGESWQFDLVTGFGDISEDGYSMVLTYSHEDQDALAGVDREFAETGFVFFDHPAFDTPLYFQNSSANSIPGNAFVYDADGGLIRSFNPYALSNNNVCAQQTTPDGETCRFDYTSTLEIIPEFTRDSLFLNGGFMVNDNLKLFGTVLASRYEMTPRIAPYPSGEFPLPLDSQLVQDNVLANLTPEELAETAEVTATWRALPAGNRTYEWNTDSLNLTLGLEGDAGEISYGGALTHAITETEQNYPTGWLLREEFVSAASAGAFNVFAPAEDFTEADQAALAPTIYSGPWDKTEVTMTMLDASASMPVFEMGGGEAQLAFGLDYRITNYQRDVAPANLNEELLFLSKDTPYELERDQYGLFAEMLFPVLENLEFTGSLRYDEISGVDDKRNGGEISDTMDDVTYKITGMWRINDGIALRGSFGTGFKAPSMREIGEPLSEFGVTSGTFACPFGPSDPLEQFCKPQETQYDIFREGFADLEPETSEQYTLGFVLTPTDNFDMTVDYWNIELEDLVERLTESQIFGDPVTYRELFTTKTNLATGKEELAIIQAAVNVGSKENEGIDYALNSSHDLDWGQLDFNFTGTYMIKSDSSLTGSSLGRFGADDAVVFRNSFNFRTSLYHGDFAHNLNFRYRSGYLDQRQEVEITGQGAPLGQGPTTEIQLDISSYTTVDYQLRYRLLEDALGLTFGVNNLTDREPPLSLRVSGAGHQVGWDPRYADPYGRTFYLQADYTF